MLNWEEEDEESDQEEEKKDELVEDSPEEVKEESKSQKLVEVEQLEESTSSIFTKLDSHPKEVEKIQPQINRRMETNNPIIPSQSNNLTSPNPSKPTAPLKLELKRVYIKVRGQIFDYLVPYHLLVPPLPHAFLVQNPNIKSKEEEDRLLKDYIQKEMEKMKIRKVPVTTNRFDPMKPDSINAPTEMGQNVETNYNVGDPNQVMSLNNLFQGTEHFNNPKEEGKTQDDSKRAKIDEYTGKAKLRVKGTKAFYPRTSQGQIDKSNIHISDEDEGKPELSMSKISVRKTKEVKTSAHDTEKEEMNEINSMLLNKYKSLKRADELGMSDDQNLNEEEIPLGVVISPNPEAPNYSDLGKPPIKAFNPGYFMKKDEVKASGKGKLQKEIKIIKSGKGTKDTKGTKKNKANEEIKRSKKEPFGKKGKVPKTKKKVEKFVKKQFLEKETINENLTAEDQVSAFDPIFTRNQEFFEGEDNVTKSQTNPQKRKLLQPKSSVFESNEESGGKISEENKSKNKKAPLKTDSVSRKKNNKKGSKASNV